MAMKFGLALPYNQTRNIAQWAQNAEEQGWDGLFLGDAIWCEDPLIGLSAAALVTQSIRLGTMIIPVPLRRPWKIASESVALDHLSDGRLILGLATGAAWMGWYAFPDEADDPKIRTEILDETIDILTLLYQRKPFDFDGKYFHLKLTLLDEQYYPPKPVQKPRIPLWRPAIWPYEKSLQRTLKCDGVIVEKRSSAGKDEEISPDDIRGLKTYLDSNQPHTRPYDVVVNGSSRMLASSQRQEHLLQLEEAGVTWWIEGLWGEPPESVTDFIQHGPPQLK